MLYFIYFFDFIIFFMSAYKTNIYYFGDKKNKNNQSKVVSFDIENKSAISYSLLKGFLLQDAMYKNQL